MRAPDDIRQKRTLGAELMLLKEDVLKARDKIPHQLTKLTDSVHTRIETERQARAKPPYARAHTQRRRKKNISIKNEHK